MPYGTVNADVIQTSTSGGILGAGDASTMKNRIINGAMVIDQRNNGASVNAVDNLYTVDRWQCYSNVSGKYTVQQNAGSVTPPSGFTNYLGATSVSSYSVASSDYLGLLQRIEGFNVGDLGWGTANAKTVTLSFWVRSSLTGTFGGSFTNASFNRSYPFSYTISSANTWEQKSVTVAGDTTGTWLTNNGTGIEVLFSLGMGSSNSGTAGAWATGWKAAPTGATSVVGTNGATFYITGVQLEVGSSATGYEYRLYNQELIVCQRYYYKTFPQDIAPANGAGFTSGIGVPTAVAYSTGSMRNVTIFPQVMRATPTVTYFNSNLGTPTTGVWSFYNGAWTANTSISNGEISQLYVSPNINNSGAFTFGYSYLVSGFLTASAEL